MVFCLEDWLSGITNIGAGECQVADRVFFRPSIFSFGGSCVVQWKSLFRKTLLFLYAIVSKKSCNTRVVCGCHIYVVVVAKPDARKYVLLVKSYNWKIFLLRSRKQSG